MYVNPTTIDITSPQDGHRAGVIDHTLRLLFGMAVIAMIASTLFVMNSSQENAIPMHFDGTVYDSVHDLSGAADTVVEVKMKRVADRVIDYGGAKPVATDPRDAQGRFSGGLATVLYEVEVKHSLVGDLQEGDTILVSLLNENKIDSDHVVKLNKGGKYMLFLTQMDAADVAGFDTGGRDLYLPLNYNNGVLAMSDAQVHLNRWVLGIDQAEAADRAEQLSMLEFTNGHGAVELELEARADVTVARNALREIVKASS